MAIRKCTGCANKVYDDHLVACPKCGETLLSSSCEEIRSDENSIRSMVRKEVRTTCLKWGTLLFGGFSVLLVVTLVGVYRTAVCRITGVVVRRVDAEFEEPRIQQITREAASERAALLLEEQIQPEVDAFKSEISRQQTDFEELVAKSAEEAKKLLGELEQKNEVTVQRLSELDKTTDEAAEALKEMERVTGFATTLLAAQNDSWEAYDQLVRWSNDKDFPLTEMATNALVKIRLSHIAFSWGYLHIIWPNGVDPSKRPLAYFRKALSENDSILHAHLVHVVWERSDIPKIERMQFLMDVLETSNSLNAKNHAGKLFVEAARDEDLKWIPFDTDALLAWWKTHKNGTNRNK